MLKADYKDDIFSGARKYNMVVNEDKTVSLIDVTEYTQEGDQFGSNDINAISLEINKLEACQTTSIAASDWSSSAPYIQEVKVVGITAEDNPVISIYLPASLTAVTVKAQTKAYGLVDRAVTGTGTITLYCYNKKPMTDFQIAVKGV